MTEKIMTDPDQYDGFATPEELNLSQEEINQLRNNKKQLSEYASEKIREKIVAIGKECMIRYNEALRKLGND